MTTTEDWERLVNSKWPENLPIPTEQEAVAGAKLLYRKGMGRPFKGKVKLTSGNRHTWIRGGVLFVNPDQRCWNGRGGWAEIVHHLAHYCQRRLYPRAKPHSSKELYLERDLTDYALEKGFLEGALKKEPEKPVKLTASDKYGLKYEKTEKAICRANEKLKKLNSQARRTENRLKKLVKQKKYYENAIHESVLIEEERKTPGNNLGLIN